jgi:hypothetical protein
LSGSIRYDDGSPATGISIQLLRLDKNAKKGAVGPAEFQPMPFDSKTDDLGHFRIAGLPAATVIAKCTLRQVRWVREQIPQRSILESVDGEGRIEHDFTPRADVRYLLWRSIPGEGCDADQTPTRCRGSGADIVIPLDKIYRVSGVVTPLEDDHAVSDGIVELLSADDGLKCSESKVGFDGSFHFALVPKGEYRLSAYGSDPVFLDRSANSRLVKGGQSYEHAMQPLSVVDHDLNNVVVQLKPKSSDPQ